MRIIMPQKRRVPGQQRVFQKQYDEYWAEIDMSKAHVDTEEIKKIVEEFVESKTQHTEDKLPDDEIKVEDPRIEELSKLTWTKLKEMYKKLWWPVDLSKVINKRRIINLIIAQEDASKKE